VAILAIIDCRSWDFCDAGHDADSFHCAAVFKSGRSVTRSLPDHPCCVFTPPPLSADMHIARAFHQRGPFCDALNREPCDVTKAA
jgi:hypothetical protein